MGRVPSISGAAVGSPRPYQNLKHPERGRGGVVRYRVKAALRTGDSHHHMPFAELLLYETLYAPRRPFQGLRRRYERNRL